MAIVPVQCWMRTFKVEFTGGAASCFVINHQDRQWLITAKHVADAAVRNGTANLTLTGETGVAVELSGPLVPVPLVEDGPDIAAFDLGGMRIVRDDLTLTPSADGIMLSQEVFFLGYPLAGDLPLMGRLPAVRRGTVSQRASLDGVAAWILDGHNLPGFSGGPVVFAEAGEIGSTWHVLGVVSAYWNHWIDVETAGTAAQGNLGLTVPTNAGIVIVYDIKHAIDAIDAYMANLADQRDGPPPPPAERWKSLTPQFLALLASGEAYGRAVELIGESVQGVQWHRTRDSGFAKAVDAALMVGRDASLEHGGATAWRRGCRCPECREHHEQTSR